MGAFQHRCCYRGGWVVAPHSFLRPSPRRRRCPGHALPDLAYHPDRPVLPTAMLITEADWARQVSEYFAPPQISALQIRTGLRALKKADLIHRCALRGLSTLGGVNDLRGRLTAWVSRDRAADATELALGVCGLLPILYDLRSPDSSASEKRTIRRRMLLQHIRNSGPPVRPCGRYGRGTRPHG